MTLINKITVAIKILISLFISFLILIKSDAGALINSIGDIIVGGNYILGYIYVFIIIVILALGLYFLTHNHKMLSNVKNKLLVFDILIAHTTAIWGVMIGTICYKMPLTLSVAINIVSLAGSVTFYLLLTFVICIVLLNTRQKDS